MPKPRNPRRVVLEKLRELGTWNRYVVAKLDQCQTTTDDGREWRPLRDDEKLENDLEFWRSFAVGCAKIAQNFHSLEEYAVAHISHLEEKALDDED